MSVAYRAKSNSIWTPLQNAPACCTTMAMVCKPSIFEQVQSYIALCLADCCADATVHLLLVHVPLGATRTGPHSPLGRRGAALQYVWAPYAQTSRLCHHAQAHIAIRSSRGQSLIILQHRNSSELLFKYACLQTC